MNNIDPIKYSELVWTHVNRFGYTDRASEEELFQEGFVGLLEAIEKYDSSKGSLETFAYWYIKRAMNGLVYRSTSDPKKGTVLKLKTVESLVEDMPEGVKADLEVATSMEDEVGFNIWLETFLKEAPFTNEQLTYFMDMHNHGDIEARDRYMERTGNSRTRASQVKILVRQVAKKTYMRLERE